MRKPQPFVIRFQKTIGGSRAVIARLRESEAKHLPFLENSTPSEIRWAMSGPPMISVRREIWRALGKSNQAAADADRQVKILRT